MSNYRRAGLAHALIAVTLCAWLGVQIEPAQPKKCANRGGEKCSNVISATTDRFP
jgi:hypothetical protein